VTTFGGKYYGFEVQEILDIGVTDFEVKTSSLVSEGFLGSLFVNEKTVSLIDIHWVAEQLKLQPKSGARFPQASGSNGPKRPKILVADDMALFRKIAFLALDEMNYETIIVSDGSKALNVLKENGSDIAMIISDIEMPNMGGLEFARQVRMMPQFKNIPMIAVSSRYDERDIEAGFKAGFDMYLEKFKKQEVAAAVKQLLEQKAAG
jgi:two-component system chemotaxis sensor kinase CheA